MATVVVLGAGVAGLGSALNLARRGHDVTVLDRDASPLPASPDEAAATQWRAGVVPQGRHTHGWSGRFRNELRDWAPDVYANLLAAGASEINLVERLPKGAAATYVPQPGDEDFVYVGARRTTVDWVLHRAALAEPRVDYRAGVTARGLEVSGQDGGARVGGVRTESGELVPAELVVDATGRRAQTRAWLLDHGARWPHAVTEDCGIVYYTRYYETHGDTSGLPLNRGFSAGGPGAVMSNVMFLGDAPVISVTMGVLPDDRALRGLADNEAFERVARSSPLVAPWLDPAVSSPTTPVSAMAGLRNSWQEQLVDGEPPLLGLLVIGDAVCITDPAFGRGAVLALAQAGLLGAAVETYGDDLRALARGWAEVLRSEIEPWYRDSVAMDRGRTAMWRAGAAGGEPPTSLPPVTADQQPPVPAVMTAAGRDADVWRAFARYASCIDLPEVLLDNDYVRQRVAEVTADGWLPPIAPGPSYAELLDLVSG